MIKIVIDLLPYLFLAISMNLVLGLYNSLEKLKQDFSFKKLFIGIGKAIIISYGFIGSAIVYDKLFGMINIGELEIAPDVLIKSAIIMYLGKALLNLKEILKVSEIIEEPIEEELDIEIER